MKQYSDAQLYNQLRFFAFLFNGEKACEAIRSTVKGGRLFDSEYLSRSFTYIFPEELTVLVLQNHELLQTLSKCVEKYLDNCGRRWVDLGTLFSRISLKSRT